MRNPGVSPSLSGSGSHGGGGYYEEAAHCLRGGPGFLKFLKRVAGGSSFEQGLLSWGAAGPHRSVCSRQIRDPKQGLCGQLLLWAERRVMAVYRSPGVKKKIQIMSQRSSLMNSSLRGCHWLSSLSSGVPQVPHPNTAE